MDLPMIMLDVEDSSSRSMLDAMSVGQLQTTLLNSDVQ